MRDNRQCFHFLWMPIFLALGCSDDGSSDGATGGAGGFAGASGFDPAFYVPPDPLPSDTPGTLLRSERMTPFADGMNVWRVLYVSQALDESPIAVSGMVAAPADPGPDDGRPVVSWGHGTKGVSDRCAPSRGYRISSHDFYDIAPELIAQGYVAVSSDYEGLGTEGTHPYLVGDSEGRGKLDIIRAARAIPEANAGNEVVVWGRSQGGHAALFAGEIAPEWAPELNLLGVVAAAPGSELLGALSVGPGVSRSWGFLWQITVGLEAAYPDLSLDDIYDSGTLEQIRTLVDEEACGREFNERAAEASGIGFETNPIDDAAWRARLEENSPARRPTEAAILLLQGTEDTIVPKPLTDILNANLCAIGTKVDYRIFEGFSHNDSTLMNMPLMLEWTAARFAGESAATTCN